jgi:hypothetical protein
MFNVYFFIQIYTFLTIKFILFIPKFARDVTKGLKSSQKGISKKWK